MVESEYSKDNYKSSKTAIGAVPKNPEILKFFLYHFKTKKTCKYPVQNYLS